MELLKIELEETRSRYNFTLTELDQIARENNFSMVSIASRKSVGDSITQIHSIEIEEERESNSDLKLSPFREHHQVKFDN
jgi:hypothetical protein